MFKKRYFKELSEKEIAQKIRKEGFDPFVITNSPNYIYSRHKHKETKLLVGLSGSMNIKVGEKEFTLASGDKLVVPGNIYHSAIVGKEGCSFFWSEKLLEDIDN